MDLFLSTKPNLKHLDELLNQATQANKIKLLGSLRWDRFVESLEDANFREAAKLSDQEVQDFLSRSVLRIYSENHPSRFRAQALIERLHHLNLVPKERVEASLEQLEKELSSLGLRDLFFILAAIEGSDEAALKKDKERLTAKLMGIWADYLSVNRQIDKFKSDFKEKGAFVSRMTENEIHRLRELVVALKMSVELERQRFDETVFSLAGDLTEPKYDELINRFQSTRSDLETRLTMMLEDALNSDTTSDLRAVLSLNILSRDVIRRIVQENQFSQNDKILAVMREYLERDEPLGAP